MENTNLGWLADMRGSDVLTGSRYGSGNPHESICRNLGGNVCVDPNPNLRTRCTLAVAFEPLRPKPPPYSRLPRPLPTAARLPRCTVVCHASSVL